MLLQAVPVSYEPETSKLPEVQDYLHFLFYDIGSIEASELVKLYVLLKLKKNPCAKTNIQKQVLKLL